jgi:hypothetical protein
VIVVLLLTGAGAASVLQLRHPRPVPAGAPATEFSAERAWADLQRIARAPHPIAGPAHDALRDYLRGELDDLGGTFVEQVAAVPELNGFEIHNLLVRFPGTDPTGTILLATHYDSVPPGPGVGDAGVSVASLVETARAIAAGRPLRNDVIVMLTDGEEAGLFGGRAFVDANPWAQDVDLVFNFEGRGVSGPPAVVEIEKPTTELLAGFLDASPSVATSPLAGLTLPESYRRRVSDFGEFRRLDIQGIHLALAGGSPYYHSPLDDLQRSSPSTLQHLGDTALGLARHFGARDLASVRSGPTATWSVSTPGIDLVAPAWIAWPLLLLAVWLTVLVVRRLPASWVVTRRAKAIGFAVPAASVVLAGLTGLIALRVLMAADHDARRMLTDLPVSWHQGSGDLVHGFLFMWCFIALAAAVVTACFELARNRIGIELLVPTGAIAWTAGLALATLVDPATAAAFAIPYVLAALGTWLWVRGGLEAKVGPGRALALAALGVPVVMMAASMTYMGYLAVTLTRVGLLSVGAAVGLGQLLPQLDVVRRVHRWLPTAIFGAIAIVLLGAALSTQQTDADLIDFVKTSSVWDGYIPSGSGQ